MRRTVTWRLRLSVLMASGTIALALSTAMGGDAGAAPDVAGTCSQSTGLPCSASAGQTYGTFTLGADGNDDEASVEAVLGHVIGSAADVTALARGLTGDSGYFDLTPDSVTGGTTFDWSYRGHVAQLAYLTVKAGTGFAVYGIAGRTSGSVDVTELLAGHDISHVSFWATSVSQTDPVAATKLHGKGLYGNTRLARIDDGTVPCLHVETAELARCRFTRNSGAWIESQSGRYAKYGQAIGLDGKPGGEYVVAAKVSTSGLVAAIQPSGHDAEGVPAGTELAAAGVVETMASLFNVTGLRLENYATREVCTTTYPHPDDATLTREYWNPTSTGGVWIYCYSGRGAGLNDANGQERDASGYYLSGTQYMHVLWSNGYEVPGAKRPSTKSYPAPGSVLVNTALIWRPVNPDVRIAN